MANVKLSEIADGGSVNAATDKLVAVRSGSSDVLVTPGSSDAETLAVSQVAHGFSVKRAVYHNGTSYALAKADAAATSDVVGVVSAVADADNFTITLSGKLTTTGLTAGVYFLSDATAGLLTLTAPTTATSIWKPIMVATSTTQGLINIQLGIVVGNGVSTPTVTVTGTPAAGNLTKFSSGTAVTNADLTGDITTSGGVSTTLATVNSNTGSFGGASSVPNFTVNGKGLITAAGATAVVAPAGTLSGTTLNGTVVSSSLTTVGTLSALAVSGNTTMSGTQVITSNSAAALVVGPNGATNPAFNVEASTASAATGVSVRGLAAGSGCIIQCTSSGTNENLLMLSKGTGTAILRSPNGGIIQLQIQLNSRLTVQDATVALVPGARTGITPFIQLSSATSTITASTEGPMMYFNNTATQSHSTGAVTLQRDLRIGTSTHTAVAASTITDCASVAIDGAPIASTNCTITNGSTLYSAGAAVGSGTTNSYGLNITANTGATNNYIARYAGSAGEVVRYRTDGQIALLATNTAAGTTGAQTINKPSGTVNFAAAATSLVVTNSLCTTSSIVFATIRTNDATAVIKNVVPAAGSFTINLNAAATAETSVGFLIVN